MNGLQKERVMFTNRRIRRVARVEGDWSFAGLIEHLLFGAVNLVFVGVMMLYVLAIFSAAMVGYQHPAERLGLAGRQVHQQVVAEKVAERARGDNPLPSMRQVRLDVQPM